MLFEHCFLDQAWLIGKAKRVTKGRFYITFSKFNLHRKNGSFPYNFCLDLEYGSS